MQILYNVAANQTFFVGVNSSNQEDKMDQMLPSPGFSIPSIGTPLHQPEEDQQILPNALQQQQQQQQQSQQQYQLQQLHGMSPNMQSGMLMIGTPQKTMHAYATAPSFATPQSLMQPQTPVGFNNMKLNWLERLLSF